MAAVQTKQADKPYTQLETITPEIAENYFKSNGLNRPIADTTVDSYARDILTGRWNLNGESIKFSRAGRLLDGQHRLLAIIKAQRPVEMMVTYGLKESVMPTLDSGKARSIGDRLKIEQGQRLSSLHVPPLVVAALCRSIALLELGNAGSRHKMKLTYSEALDIFQKYDSEIGWVLDAIGHRIEPNTFSGGAPVLACFAFCRSINRSKLETLAYEFKHGGDPTGKRRVSPAAMALRTMIASGSSHGNTIRKSDTTWRRELVPKTLRAIEASLNEEDVRSLKYDDEIYARMIELKKARG